MEWCGISYSRLQFFVRNYSLYSALHTWCNVDRYAFFRSWCGVTKLPVFYKTQSFIALFTAARRVSILSQIHPFHPLPSCYFYISLMLFSHLLLGNFQLMYSFRFSHQNYVCIYFLPHPTFPSVSFFWILSTKLCLSRSKNGEIPHDEVFFFFRRVTSSLLDPDIYLGTMIMNTPNLCSSLNIRKCFYICTKQGAKS